jgi:hypothetical protein
MSYELYVLRFFSNVGAESEQRDTEGAEESEEAEKE